MSEPLFSSSAEPHARRVMRIRLSDVPALFSEGPEPARNDPTKAHWLQREATKHHVKMAWPAFIDQLSHRSKAFWPGHLQT